MSVLLIGQFAHHLTSDDFSTSQVAILAGGLIVLISDSGLVLLVTRTLSQGVSGTEAVVLGTRAVVALLTWIVLISVLQFVGMSSTAVAILAFSGSIAGYILRSHLFAQLRASHGTLIEIRLGSISNTAESVVGVVSVAATGSVVAALGAMSVVSLVATVCVALRVRRVSPKINLEIEAPSWRLLRSGASAAVLPISFGMAPKVFAVMLPTMAIGFGAAPVQIAAAVLTVRLVDAMMTLLIVVVVVPVHAAESRSQQPPSSALARVVIAAGVVGGGGVAGSAALLLRVPDGGALFLSSWVAALGALWFLGSYWSHTVHARGWSTSTTAPAILLHVVWGVGALAPSAMFALVSVLYTGLIVNYARRLSRRSDMAAA